MAIDGPCIVELPDTNVVVDTHFDLTCDAYGNFLLDAKGAGLNERAVGGAG